MVLNIGDIIQDSQGKDYYTIARPITGGDASIYIVAEQSGDKTPTAAVKIWKDPTSREEYEYLTRLTHQSIMPTQGYIGAANSPIGYVMPYRPVNLTQWYNGRGWLAPFGLITKRGKDDVKEMINQIGAAIECLHQHNVVHLDIAPDNILFATDGTHASLSDFGSAQSRFGTLTTLKARPEFVPENYDNLGDNALIDIYAFATAICYMYEGRLPERGMKPNFNNTPSGIQPALLKARSLGYTSIMAFIQDLNLGFAQPDQAKPQGCVFEILTQPISVKAPPRVVHALQVLIIMISFLVFRREVSDVPQEGIWRIGLPLALFVLAIIRPGISAWVAVMLEAVILLAVAPSYGLALLLIAIGVGIGSLWSESYWLLMLLLVIPLIDHAGGVFLFPVLAWLLKPDRFLLQPHNLAALSSNATTLREPTVPPIASLTVGVWFLLYLTGQSCPQFTELCREAARAPLDLPAQAVVSFASLPTLWPGFMEWPQPILSTTLQNIVKFTPIWPLLVWICTEWLGALLFSYLRIRQRFAPYARALVSLILLATTLLLLTGMVFLDLDESLPVAFEIVINEFSRNGRVMVLVVLLLAFLYDPLQEEHSSKSPRPLLWASLLACAIYVALPFARTLVLRTSRGEIATPSAVTRSVHLSVQASDQSARQGKHYVMEPAHAQPRAGMEWQFEYQGSISYTTSGSDGGRQVAKKGRQHQAVTGSLALFKTWEER